MTQPSQKKCAPCEKETKPLESEAIVELAQKLPAGWRVINEHHLEKEFKFKDFTEALAFTNLVGQMANKENHHPDIHLAWGKVRILLWTHTINGLSPNDFIMATKCEALAQQPVKVA